MFEENGTVIVLNPLYDFLRAGLNDIVYHYFKQDYSLKEEEMVDTIYDLIQSYKEYLIQHRKIAKEKNKS